MEQIKSLARAFAEKHDNQQNIISLTSICSINLITTTLSNN